MAEGGSSAVFATTHWSVVLAAGGETTPQATDALEKLCRAYWYPLYAYVRRRGYGPDDAQDLTQSFFARLKERARHPVGRQAQQPAGARERVFDARSDVFGDDLEGGNS